jgi:hypothetical protein
MKDWSNWITPEFKLKGSLGSCRLTNEDLLLKTACKVDMFLSMKAPGGGFM